GDVAAVGVGAAQGDVAGPGVVAVQAVQGAEAVEPRAVERQLLVGHDETGAGGVLDLQGARGGQGAVDERARGGRVVGRAEGLGVADGEDAVVDRGRAAVGVGVTEDDLAGPHLGEVVAQAQVGDEAGNVQRAGNQPGAGADVAVAVQGDG